MKKKGGGGGKFKNGGHTGTETKVYMRSGPYRTAKKHPNRKEKKKGGGGKKGSGLLTKKLDKSRKIVNREPTSKAPCSCPKRKKIVKTQSNLVEIPNLKETTTTAKLYKTRSPKADSKLDLNLQYPRW